MQVKVLYTNSILQKARHIWSQLSKLCKYPYPYISTIEQSRLLYLPTQIHSLIGGEHVTCHGSKYHDALGQTKLHYSLGKQQFELLTHTWSSRALLKPQQIIFTPSWQLKGFKQELKKLSSFYTINTPNLLTRQTIMRWERWETSAKSTIWPKASTKLAKQT